MDVSKIPPRVAYAVHALLEAASEHDGGPVTTREVCVYDDPATALTAAHTSASLWEASLAGLASIMGPGLWTPTDLAWGVRRRLEDMILGEGTP